MSAKKSQQQSHSQAATAKNHAVETAKNNNNVISLLKEIDLPLIIGSIITIIIMPVYFFFLFLIKSWDLLDRQFKGQPRSGLIFKFFSYLNKTLTPITSQYVIEQSDSYIVLVILFLGLGIPLFVILSAFYAVNLGYLPISVIIIYHMIRLGPGLVTFSLIQSLSHKEGHAGYNQFKGRFKSILGNSFSLWIGIFYGILPYSFSLGHTINHHKYNNTEFDVIATSDDRRDSIISYMRYVCRFLLYSTNISPCIAFYSEKRYKQSIELIVGMLQLILFIFLSYKFVSFEFCLCFCIYPFFENVCLIAAYNWTWHAFIDPEDPLNDYANSITILNGNYNMIDRDLHVVHHAYPGVHWSQYNQLYLKDQENYLKNNASLFKQTHATELFLLIITGKYNILAQKFIFKDDKISMEDKILFIQKRLRSITWGKKQNCGFVQKTTS